jgi:hypothetical protein
MLFFYKMQPLNSYNQFLNSNSFETGSFNKIKIIFYKNFGHSISFYDDGLYILSTKKNIYLQKRLVKKLKKS